MTTGDLRKASRAYRTALRLFEERDRAAGPKAERFLSRWATRWSVIWFNISYGRGAK